MSKIKIENVRLSFPSLFKKSVFDGVETKFEATFLFEKGSPTHKKVEKAIDDYIEEKFEGKIPKGLKITAFKDGDEKEYDGYEGMMALKAGSTKRPLIIDADKTPLAEEDGRLYAGCYVNAILDFWYSDHPKGGKQILGNLIAVQFYRNGEPFSDGASASVDDFEDVSEF
jgi:hypothetical protein